MNLNALLELFKNKNSDSLLQNRVKNLNYSLLNLKEKSNNFNEKEYDFLRTSYINFIDNDKKILDLGQNFSHAGYFFINKFFENNIETFYLDFKLKNVIESHKQTFANNQNISVSNAIKGSDAQVISLYIFLENFARLYGDFCEDRELKNSFKKKLVELYGAIYDLFESCSTNLVKKYLGIAIYNHPMLILELINSSLKDDNFMDIVLNFTQEHTINENFDGEYEILDNDSLIEFISLIAIINNNINLVFYNKNSIKILNLIYQKDSSEISKFLEFSKDFIENFKSCPTNSNIYEKKIYCQIFFEFFSNFNNDNISKNTMYIGSAGTGKYNKIKELLDIKNISFDKYNFITLHQNYDYSDIMDGFVGTNFINGAFKNICKKAYNDPNNDYFFIIENINNCDTNALFSEICELLTDRFSNSNQNAFIRTKNAHIIDNLDNKEELSVALKNGFSLFCIPDNLYIITTLDPAFGYDNICVSLISKFEVIKLSCDYDYLEMHLKDITNYQQLIKIFKKFNENISTILNDESMQLGHFILIKIKNYIKNSDLNNENLAKFFNLEIEPSLKVMFSKFLTYSESKKNIDSLKSIFNLNKIQ
ncbi:hypothetical protein F1B92_03360 [Campylobacter sp. FMV-PI01]|uniref:Uncharacterized protein n=1 Tax=Campylobacter portucalensis TaxID=2608384 RepID=A0A6L5WKG4_9BACT|nr:hypothetical protein [Campylobacter portucalensis]MSN96241.1 hypothetical protein [Campylobacter portucalensis]